MRALYIEDDEVQSRSGARAVRHLDGQLTWVTTGADALAAVQRNTYDIVLCDLGLPDIDGLELVRQLRYKMPTVPIVVLTGYSFPGQREACLQAGCTEYVIKPVELQELEATLRRHTFPAVP